MRQTVLALIAVLALAASPRVTEEAVRAAITPLGGVNAEGIATLKTMGPAILPHLARLYSAADSTDDRAVIAWILYSVGWKSPEARAALLRDLDTNDQKLRLQVQWALGRVSDDTEVVDMLARIMRSDSNPLFRDKAACALAYDQIHLTERQKVLLFARLIEGLSDEKEQVRAISIQALQIHTGQSKGFNPGAPLATRSAAIEVWKKWLTEYERNL